MPAPFRIRVGLADKYRYSLSEEQDTHTHSFGVCATGIHLLRRMSKCIPAPFSAFWKGSFSFSPSGLCERTVGLSRGDSATKAWWIRAAAFAPKPLAAKQSQHATDWAWEHKERGVAFAPLLPFVERLKEEGFKGHLSAGCHGFPFSWRLISTKNSFGGCEDKYLHVKGGRGYCRYFSC